MNATGGRAGTPRLVRVGRGFESWRDAARRLLAAEIPPDAVAWRATDDAPDLLETAESGLPAVAANAEGPMPRVPRAFVDTARLAVRHADPARWPLLYRTLWRIVHGERALMRIAVDEDVHRLLMMAKAVSRETHKVHAFTRFRRVAADDGTEQYVAWLATEHDVLGLAAPLFARRFPNMRWSILGPRDSAHWDGERLVSGPGVARAEAPRADALEALWRTYYASVFNPARCKPRAMRAEMPKRYWSALPEAALIPALLGDAAARVRRMREAELRPPQAERAARRERK